jgi:uncharacterized protein YjbI with pentapeptide repeats
MPARTGLPSPPREPVERLVGAELTDDRPQLALTDVELDRANLANLRARGVHATRVVIRASRLTGAGLTEGRLSDVVVTGCSADLAAFSFSGLERVTFEDCVLTNASFLEARLYAVRFHRCRLDGADFRGARMTSCELRGCTLDGLQGIEHLRGAAMEWPDIVAAAGTLAAALGISVLDPD